MAGDESIGPAYQAEKSAATHFVPGLGIGLGRRHPDATGLGSLANLLEHGDAVEDVAIEAGKVVSGRRGSSLH